MFDFVGMASKLLHGNSRQSQRLKSLAHIDYHCKKCYLIKIIIYYGRLPEFFHKFANNC